MSATTLEKATELVIARLDTYHLSSGEVVRFLEKAHADLLALKRQEETPGIVRETAPSRGVPVDWKRSITRYTVMCLECGAVFKQLLRHIRGHGFDADSYRVKYGIPRTQALAAQEISTRRRRLARKVRPWEKGAKSNR